MEVVERIKAELGSSPVVLFMKGTPDFPQCGFSAQTVAALRALGAEFKHVNIFEEPEMREALKRFSNWPTYPQLYVNGELIGGCDIALEMYRSGELRKLLDEAGALSTAGARPDSRPCGRALQRRQLRFERRLIGAGLRGRAEPAEGARALLGAAVALVQAIAHQTEDVGAALCVVAGVVCAARVPFEAGDGDGLGEHRLPERGPGKRRRVEAGERVEGIALHVRARDGGIEESQVEGRVVADQDGAAALVGAHRVTDLAEDSLQRIPLRQRRTQRVMRVDAGDR